MLSSYNGWPANKDQAEIGVTPFAIKGTAIKIRCAKHAGPLLAAFAAEFNTLVEPIEQGALDDWAYAFRMVRGSTDKLSNHASGSAIDLNATQHALGKSGTFRPMQEAIIRQLCKKYGLAWGGDYKNRKDEMHFEVALTMLEAKKHIKHLGLGAANA